MCLYFLRVKIEPSPLTTVQFTLISKAPISAIFLLSTMALVVYIPLQFHPCQLLYVIVL